MTSPQWENTRQTVTQTLLTDFYPYTKTTCSKHRNASYSELNKPHNCTAIKENSKNKGTDTLKPAILSPTNAQPYNMCTFEHINNNHKSLQLYLLKHVRIRDGPNIKILACFLKQHTYKEMHSVSDNYRHRTPPLWSIHFFHNCAIKFEILFHNVFSSDNRVIFKYGHLPRFHITRLWWQTNEQEEVPARTYTHNIHTLKLQLDYIEGANNIKAIHSN